MSTHAPVTESKVAVEQRSAASITTQTFRVGPEARRQAMLLIIGVVTLWLFALWTLVTLFENGLGGAEWVSLLLMLGIIVVAPAVVWALLEEAHSTYSLELDGLRYRSLGGVALKFAHGEIERVPAGRRGRLARFFLGEGSDTSEAAAEDSERDGFVPRYRATGKSAQLRNPAVRFAHMMAYGDFLPLHASFENRDDLYRALEAVAGARTAASPAEATAQMPTSRDVE